MGPGTGHGASDKRDEFLAGFEIGFADLVTMKNGCDGDTEAGYMVNPEALLAQCSAVTKREIELVYIVPPTTHVLRVPRWLEAGSAQVRCLRFDRPARYPVLFEKEQRFDKSHLSGSGARIWSNLLAERYAETL